MTVAAESIEEKKILDEANEKIKKKKKTEWLPADFGERERQLREKNEYTLEFVADMFGTSASTISRLENGKNNTVSIMMLSGLADLYHVSVDFLLGKVDRPERTYYELQDIGLSSRAGLALYSGKADPGTVSRLLENKEFMKLTHEIRDYVAYAPDGSDFLIEFTSCNKFHKICDYSYMPDAKVVGRYVSGINGSKERHSLDSIADDIKNIIRGMKDKKESCVRSGARFTADLLLILKETHPELEGMAPEEIKANVIVEKILENFVHKGKISDNSRELLQCLRDTLIALRLDDEEENGTAEGKSDQ